MNQQTPDQSKRELKAIIVGIFEHVHMKEKEKAMLSAGRMDAHIEQSGIPNPDWQRQEGAKDGATNWASFP